MGFSCFICKKPFQEEEHVSQKGGGDGKMVASASATMCGHMFHSKCLQDYFDKISRNAWSPKQCPKCEKPLGVRDVIRVHAYPYDNNNFPSIEDLQEQLKRVQQEKAEAFKRYEAVYKENCSLKYSLDLRRHECEELAVRFEQLARRNKVISGENDSIKFENEKLKTIVLKLTEKITVGSVSIEECPFTDTEVNNGCIAPPNHNGGVPFLSDSAGYTSGGYDMQIVTATNNNNYAFNYGSQMRSVGYSHPPGFMPTVLHSEGVSEQPASPNSEISGNNQRRTLPAFNQDTHKLAAARESGNNAGGSSIRSQTVPQFSRIQIESSPCKNGTPMSEVNRNASNNLVNTASNANDFPAERKSSVPIESGRGNGIAIANTCKISNVAKSSGASESAQSVSRTCPKNGGSDTTYIDPYDEETEGNEKWHEKKSRRRANSKGSSSRASVAAHIRADDKRYGYFKCPTCRAEWGSSKSVLNQPQVCRYCKTEVHPYKQDFILSRKQLELKQLEASQASRKN